MPRTRTLLAALLALLLLLTACSSDDGGEDLDDETGRSGQTDQADGDDDRDEAREAANEALGDPAAGEGGAVDDTADAGDDAAQDTAAQDTAAQDTAAQDTAAQDTDEAMAEEAAAEDATGATAGSTADVAQAPPAPASGQSPLDAYLPPPDVVEPPRPTTPETTVNPFVETVVDDRSTFGLDVDTGSFAYARAQINRGQAPDPALIRVEEFVNAVDYGDEPDAGETFTVDTHVAPWPHASTADAVLLRVGLSTPPAAEDRPASLVFVVDTSGSMTDLLGVVQDSLRILTRSLEPGDEVAIVTYSDTAEPILRVTDAAHADTILDGIDRLEIGGSTNLEAGLDVGYAVARELAAPDRTTRVVLASDGIANVGSTTPERILDTVDQGASDGVELVTVGFGLQGFNDPLMEQLANQGDGFYGYVDTLGDAEALFSGDLIATRPAIAREARAQVVFDDEQVAAYRLLGYENRDIADDDFRDDTVDAGELQAGHAVTALYELVLTGTPTGEPLATVQLRWLDPEDGQARERAHEVTADDLSRTWAEAPADLRMAGTVAAWAEWLRASPYATDRPGDLRRDASDLIGAFEGAADLTDLIRRSV